MQVTEIRNHSKFGALTLHMLSLCEGGREVGSD